MSALRWAVAAVVVDQGGRVLLCRQSGAGRRWALPGGRPRRDESPLTAAVREIRTETGWTVDLVDLVGLYRLGAAAPAPPAGHCAVPAEVLVHVFRARVRPDRPPAAPPGGCELAWHPPDALPAALTPITRAALTDAHAGRAGVLRDAPPEPAGGAEPAGGSVPPGQRAGGGQPDRRR